MSLQVAAFAMMAAGSVLKSVGTRQQAEAEAAIYEYNEQLARREAAHKRQLSLEEQAIRRRQMYAVLKEQRAKYAKGSVQMVGSPLEVQLRSAGNMAADIVAMAYGRTLESQRLISRARIEKFKAKATRKAGKLAAIGPLIAGAGQMATFGLTTSLVEKGKI